MLNSLDQIVDGISSRVVELRRLIHQNPEPSGCEEKTAALVTATLRELGIPYREKVGGYGVVGLVEGKVPGPTLAIRADMDALPLADAKNAPYSSKIPGVTHACGHDAHTAMLLGVAALLSQQPLPGRVRLLFQPSEEVFDIEGVSGAPRMIADGAVQDVNYGCRPPAPVSQAQARQAPTLPRPQQAKHVARQRGQRAGGRQQRREVPRAHTRQLSGQCQRQRECCEPQARPGAPADQPRREAGRRRAGRGISGGPARPRP